MYKAVYKNVLKPLFGKRYKHELLKPVVPKNAKSGTQLYSWIKAIYFCFLFKMFRTALYSNIIMNYGKEI